MDVTAVHMSTCRVMKLLSEDPANYEDAPREGIRRVLEEVTGKKYPRDQPLDTSRVASIRMGTTVRVFCLAELSCHSSSSSSRPCRSSAALLSDWWDVLLLDGQLYSGSCKTE